MEHYIEKSAQFTETRNAHKFVGLRVLAASGDVVGRVTQVQLHHTTHAFEGVVIKGRIPSGKGYLGKNYIEQITPEAVLLNVEPAFLYIGRKVLSSDGKTFGKVKGVHRVQHTNTIATFTVKRGMFRTISIPMSHVKKLGDSVILKKTYDEARKRGA